MNGKVRDRAEVPVGLSDDDLVARAKELPRVRSHLDGKEIRKAIVVPGKLVNLVVLTVNDPTRCLERHIQWFSGAGRERVEDRKYLRQMNMAVALAYSQWLELDEADAIPAIAMAR